MKRIFIDLDGTLALWRSEATQDDLYSDGYYYDLPAQENVLKGIKHFMAGVKPHVEVYILSCFLPKSAYALRDKRRWCRELLPEIPEQNLIFVPYGKKKEGYVPGGIRKDDILLDDYTQNLLSWSGVGVKCRTRINHTKGTWKGPMVDAGWPPERIAKSLAQMCKG